VKGEEAKGTLDVGAGRQRRDGRDSLTLLRHFWKNATFARGIAAVRLQPMLAGVFKKINPE